MRKSIKMADVYFAIKNDKSLEEILELTKKVEYPNRKEFPCNSYWAPVHAAVYKNNVALIRKLIMELNFRPDAAMAYFGNKTPAHLAVQHKQTDAFKALLTFKPDLNLLASLEGKVMETVHYWIDKLEDKKIKEEFLKAIREFHENTVMPKEWSQAQIYHISSLNKYIDEGTEAESQLSELGILPLLPLQLEKVLKAQRINTAIETLQSGITEIENKIKELKLSEDFRTPERLEKLKGFMEEIGYSKTDVAKKLVIDDDALCPICIEVPELGTQMKMCVCCGETFCDGCRAQITNCPMCRVNFFKRPTIRNRKAEILIEKFWKQ